MPPEILQIDITAVIKRSPGDGSGALLLDDKISENARMIEEEKIKVVCNVVSLSFLKVKNFKWQKNVSRIELIGRE